MGFFHKGHQFPGHHSFYRRRPDFHRHIHQTNEPPAVFILQQLPSKQHKTLTFLQPSPQVKRKNSDQESLNAYNKLLEEAFLNQGYTHSFVKKKIAATQTNHNPTPNNLEDSQTHDHLPPRPTETQHSSTNWLQNPRMLQSDKNLLKYSNLLQQSSYIQQPKLRNVLVKPTLPDSSKEK